MKKIQENEKRLSAKQSNMDDVNKKKFDLNIHPIHQLSLEYFWRKMCSLLL